jgi:hypothetical protein
MPLTSGSARRGYRFSSASHTLYCWDHRVRHVFDAFDVFARQPWRQHSTQGVPWPSRAGVPSVPWAEHGRRTLPGRDGGDSARSLAIQAQARSGVAAQGAAEHSGPSPRR